MTKTRVEQTKRVNRLLADKMMDRIDHALGRPIDPLAPTYRDHFAAPIDPPCIAAELALSPFWDDCGKTLGQHYFCVNQKGREALAAYLEREFSEARR